MSRHRSVRPWWRRLQVVDLALDLLAVLIELA